MMCCAAPNAEVVEPHTKVCYDISNSPDTSCVTVVDTITHTVLEVHTVNKTHAQDYSTLCDVLTSLMTKY